MRSKKVISLLLAMVMCLSLLPISAVVEAAESVTFTALDGTAGANYEEGYENLLDGKKTEADGTKWCVGGITSFPGAYIVIEASKAVRILGYTFTTGNDNTTATERNPKNWVLYGANDYDTTEKTATWTAIHTVTNDTTMQDENYTSYSFSINGNTSLYRYYKLSIAQTRGSACMQLSELEFDWSDVAFTVLDGTTNSKTSESYPSLLDSNVTTKWCYEVSGQPYVIFKTSRLIIVNGYILTTANDTASNSDRNPKDWVLYGCNDYDEATKSGGSWAEIQSVTNDTTLGAVNDTPYTFTVTDNRAAYRYYKLVIKARRGGTGGLMQLSELELLYDSGETLVTFDKNGGDTEAEPMQMLPGGLPTVAPTKRGYVLAGWYQKDGTDGDWGEEFTEDTEVTEPITVYAKYRAAIINFNKNGGDTEAIPDHALATDEQQLPTTQPTRSGYYFGGWYTKDGTDGDWGEEYTDGSTITTDIMVYARWRDDALKFKVITGENLPGKQKSTIYLGRYPQTLLGYLSEAPAGTENVDWVKNNNSGSTAYYSIEPVKWRVLSNDGDKLFVLADKSIETMYYNKTGAVRWVYSALYSYLNGLSNNQDNIDFSAAEDNLKASVFSQREQELMYSSVSVLSLEQLEDTSLGLGTDASRISTYTDFAKNNGKYNRPSNNNAFTVRADDFALTHYFVGLSYQGSFHEGTIFSEDRNNLSENYYIRPAFSMNLSQVILATDVDGGKNADSLTAVEQSETNDYKLTVYDRGRSDFSAAYSSRSGNVVTVSYSGASYGNNEYISAIVKRDGAVRSYGKLQKVNSSAKASGSLTITLPDDFDYNAGDRLCVFNEQVNNSYDMDLSSALNDIAVMSDVFSVTFDKNGGDTEAAPNILYPENETSATLGALPTQEPTRKHYYFEGWYTQNGTDDVWGTEFTADTAVTKTMTVYAKWRKVQVTFDQNNDDSESSSLTLAYDEGLPTQEPTRIGYDFSGWYTKNGMDGDWGEAYTAESYAETDITVYAKWTPWADDNVTFTVIDGENGFTDENYDKLMDGSLSTKWCVNFKDADKVYIVIKASQSISIHNYTFTTGNDNKTATGRNPKDWVLSGSNNYNETTKAGTWTAIHTVTGDTTMQDVNLTAYTFTPEEDAEAYQYYKLVITQNGGNDCLQLSELSFSYSTCNAHSWVKRTVAANCVEEGSVQYRCSECNAIHVVEILAALGHIETAEHTCSRCGLAAVAKVDDAFYFSIPSAIESANGGTVKLIKNIDLDETLEIAASATLDLNGYTLAMSGVGRVLTVKSGGFAVTLTDSSTAQSGKITGGNGVKSGGGIYVEDTSSLCVAGGTISNCSATQSGGGIYVKGNAGFSMTGGTVSDCTSNKDGGALCLESSKQSMSLTGGTFMNNSTREYGGGIYSARPLSLENVSVKNNSAGRCGGGIYQIEKTLTLGSNTVIEGNYFNDGTTLNKNGGGVYAGGATVIMNSGSIIRNCSAVKYGGGIMIHGNNSNFTMNEGAVIENNSAEYGGGIQAQYGRSSGGVNNINGGEIKGNTATYGGGISLWDATTNINGGNIQNNSSEYGGGVYVKDKGTLNVKGGTISNNKATTGGGLYCQDTAAVGLTDISIIGNTAATGGGLFAASSTVTVNSGVTITGNTITAAAGTTGAASNLYLKSGCVVTATAETGTTTEEGATTATPAASLIGVTLEDGTGNITAESESDYSAYFTSDVSGYVVSYADGVVKLGRLVPKLTLTQDAVTAENVPEGATLFVASYSGDKLLSLYRGAATSGTTALNTLGLDLSGADKLSAFMWNGTSLSPLCGNASITLGTD